jgi:hypothetical protein
MSISSRPYQRLDIVALAGPIPAALPISTTGQGAAPTAAAAFWFDDQNGLYDSPVGTPWPTISGSGPTGSGWLRWR